MRQRRMLTYAACVLAAAAAAGCGQHYHPGMSHHDHHAHAEGKLPHYGAVTGPEAAVVHGEKAITLVGAALTVGDEAPDVKLVSKRLRDVQISSLRGKVAVLSIVPSLDTPVCNSTTLKLNRYARKMGSDVVFVSVSRDLPFALDRWSEEHNVENVLLWSDYYNGTFGPQYGLLMKHNKLLGRAVLVIDAAGTLRHVQVVSDLRDEPDYDPLLKTIKELRAK